MQEPMRFFFCIRSIEENGKFTETVRQALNLNPTVIIVTSLRYVMRRQKRNQRIHKTLMP